MGSGKNSASQVAEQNRADEVARQQRVREGTTAVDNTFDNQFTNDFYDKLSKNYNDYALPQVDKQYADAQKELTYALARQGNLNSSARSAKEAELQTAYDTNKATVANNALGYVSTAKNNVADARSGLISELNTTGDNELAANSAVSRAAALSQPQSYSALGDLFSTFTSTLSKGIAAQQSALATSAGTNGAGSGVALYPSTSAVSNKG